MHSPLNIYGVDRWTRFGRGKELQFFATDAEVENWLITSLPAIYGPYQLIGCDLIKENGAFVEYPFRCDISCFRKCRQGKNNGPRYEFWIHSEALTPGLSFEFGSRMCALCALNGLVLIQHGFLHRGRKDASRIAVVDTIRDSETMEIKHHRDYDQVFRSLFKVIKKSLVYSSIQRFADGHEEEDTRIERMTIGAAQEYEAGVAMTKRPGRLLHKVQQ